MKNAMIVLSLVLAASLSACGGGGSDDSATLRSELSGGTPEGASNILSRASTDARLHTNPTRPTPPVCAASGVCL